MYIRARQVARMQRVMLPSGAGVQGILSAATVGVPVVYLTNCKHSEGSM